MTQSPFDNEVGDPMFQPQLTGDSLQGEDMADWIEFCEAVVASEPDGDKLYNTWFENRWARASEKLGGGGRDRKHSVVRAFKHKDQNVICIRCPGHVWARELRSHMDKWRGLSRRSFYVLAPGEDTPKPFDADKARRDIAEWRRLADDPNAPEPPVHYLRLINITQTMLDRRNTQ